MRKGISGLLVLLAAALAFAGGTPVMNFPLKDTDKPAFEKNFSVLSAHKVIRGNFRQTKTVPQIKRNFVSEGTFSIAQGYGILWNVNKPFPSTLVITADKMIQKSAQGKTSVMDASENAAFRHFSDMIQSAFSGKPKELYKHFSVYYCATGKNSWTAGFVPLESSVRSAVSALELTGGASALETVRIQSADGGTTLYEFSAETSDDALTAKEKETFGTH